MHRIVDVRVIHGYTLLLRFSDGRTKCVDLEPFIGRGISAALLDEDYFRQVSIDSAGGIAWPNGYDFCPNYLYEDVPAVESVAS